MGIEPIKRVMVGEQVFQQMKELLITGEWRPGQKLPSENELAEKFNVSRITVRQALQKLSTLGLVETRLGEGSFVKEIDAGDSMNALIPTVYLGENMAAEILEFREIIETECAGIAAKRAVAQDITDLKEIWQRMRLCKDQLHLKEFAVEDLNFHFKIAEITQNRLIVRTNLILRDVLKRAMEETIDKMGCDNGLHYHKLIIQNIEAGDAIQASKTMREHIKKNKFTATNGAITY